MNKTALASYLDTWVERLSKEDSGDYTAAKVKQLIESYHSLVVAEIVVDAVCEDLKHGNLMCA
jgi:hypothetical protein